jgi:hypothetical protein
VNIKASGIDKKKKGMKLDSNVMGGGASGIGIVNQFEQSSISTVHSNL